MAELDEAACSRENPDSGDEPEQVIVDQAAGLAESGDLEAARALVQRAWSCEADDAALRLGRLLDSRGLTASAETAFRLADDGGLAEGALDLGLLLEQRGDTAGAEAACRRADERGSPDGALYLGLLLQQRGELTEAEAAYGRAEVRGSAAGAFQRGFLLIQRGETAEAEAAFRRADERGSPDGALYLGFLLQQRGELTEAQDAYRRADEGGLAGGALSLGSLLAQRGETAEAEVAFRRADERGSPMAVNRLVRMLVRQAEREKAEDVVDEAAAGADPARLFAANYGLAEALTDLNMPAAAELPARRAVELEPRSEAPRLLLAVILTMRGQCDEAEEAFCAAAKIGSSDHGTADGQVRAQPGEGQGTELSPAGDEHWRAWPRRLLSMLKSLPPFGSRPQLLSAQARAEALGDLLKLADGLTQGFARMIAGHPVTALPAEQGIFDRLTIELRPLVDRGYAYDIDFGQYGEMQVTGDLSAEARIDISYTDSSGRENLALRKVVSHPREIRLTVRASRPYEVASSLSFTMVHGRPAPAAALQSGPLGSPEDGPPWPKPRSVSSTQVTSTDRCKTPGCRRAMAGQTGACLEHIQPSRLEEALAWHTRELDASGMTITAELLAAILKGPAARPVSFEAACFDTVADFRDRLFTESMSFEFASFRHGALFTRSTFAQLTSFSGAEFLSDAVFDRARFHGAVLFDGVRFRGDASFESCVAHGGASFSNAQFRHAAAFAGCEFRADVRSVFTNYLTGAATFAGAVFSEPPDFSPALVRGVCDFDGARFESGMLVTLNIACSAASFVDTDFAGGADLVLSPCDVILDGANFSQLSTITTWRNFPFDEIRADLQKNPLAIVRLASVRGARIGLLRLDEVDLRACRFDRAHGLETTRIEGSDVFAGPPRGYRVRRPVVAEEWSWRSYGRRGGPSLERVGPGITITRPSGSRGWAQIPEECEAPDVLADEPGAISRRKIMATYHDLRVAREQMNDQLNAAGYYYSEMQMRGEHDHSSVLDPEKTRSWVELILVRVFWVISGYDVRPARSIISFAAVIMAGAMVLWQWGYRAGVGFGHAAITSLAAATALFGGVDWNLLTDPGRLTEIFLRVAGPILLALTALGIRSLARR